MNKTLSDEDRINLMTSLSENVELKSGEAPSFKEWYSYRHQKMYIFQIAKEMFVMNEVSAEEAIDEAQNFVNTYFEKIVKESQK